MRLSLFGAWRGLVSWLQSAAFHSQLQRPGVLGFIQLCGGSCRLRHQLHF